MTAIPTKDGKEYELTDDFYSDLKEAYPYVDIDAELIKMRIWCISNPSRKKTKRGMKRFINSWLSRAEPTKAPIVHDESLYNI